MARNNQSRPQQQSGRPQPVQQAGPTRLATGHCTAAAAAAAAVGAGVFLWSRRNRISDQISSLADQISEWREGMSSPGDFGTGSRKRRWTELHGRSRRAAAAAAIETELAEEALTLKETGKAARRPVNPVQPGAPSGAPFLCCQEVRDRFAELGFGDELIWVPGTSREDCIGQHRGELPGRSIVVVLVAAHHQGRHGECLQPVHECVGETLVAAGPPRRGRSSGSS